jgi:hypothetical protein
MRPLAVRSVTPAGFVGITGWLPSEQVAGFNRNRWLLSSESAALKIEGIPADLRERLQECLRIVLLS